jgi:AmmeMemoRadiSam system protein A
LSGEPRGSTDLALDAPARLSLLEAAREAIAAHLAGRRALLPAADADVGHGAFVTLRRTRDGELRGCVGQLESSEPLVEIVVAMAVAAATRDGRFEPVTAGELASLRVEISVLGPLRPIDPGEVEVGRHGLLVSRGDRRGVLLPQVAVEHAWDRESFLDQTCVKAGLPADAWRQPGVEIRGFTATVFGEA